MQLLYDATTTRMMATTTRLCFGQVIENEGNVVGIDPRLRNRTVSEKCVGHLAGPGHEAAPEGHRQNNV
jgi:hypothetical protein